MPFLTGKNKIGRFVVTIACDGRPAVVRYYPQTNPADFNTAILAELGERPGTPLGEAFKRWSVTEKGWKRDYEAVMADDRLDKLAADIAAH